MVKGYDNYPERRNDDRFKKFDAIITNNDNSKKVTIILEIGIIICAVIFGISQLLQAVQPIPPQYDLGLNISYDPQSSSYYINYTNPNQTTTSMDVIIKIIYSTTPTSAYSTVYSTSINKFPSNISYIPSNKDMSHIITVTLTKSSGNYSYFFTNTPSDDDKLYVGVTQYGNIIYNTINKYVQSNNMSL